jgi:hypothetical protein
VAGGDFGRHVGFMHRLVGQHGLADDVADGEDVRHVGAHLGIDRDEAAVGDDHAGLVGADLLAVGRAARGLQDHVVLDRLGARLRLLRRRGRLPWRRRRPSWSSA